MDVISTINNSISIVSRLREIAKNLSKAEFKNLLANLSNELADAKIEIASLKQTIALLTEENNTLKASKGDKREQPILKWVVISLKDKMDYSVQLVTIQKDRKYKQLA